MNNESHFIKSKTIFLFLFYNTHIITILINYSSLIRLIEKNV